MLNINNFKHYIPQELLLEAEHFLSSGSFAQISEDDIGCYNASYCIGSTEFWVELTLDESSDANIEDAYCQICGPTLCVHTVAICLAAYSSRIPPVKIKIN